ncbi:tripartite tricarboxylate transporter permease [Sedimentitalea sp. XS_ASV28]|uniref:tripartite tricarboxylate transporter permease n=1 Tax=Sedimentitalea sp. XS_ASV28 TaxID=3241296 RepID=UPI0035124887
MEHFLAALAGLSDPLNLIILIGGTAVGILIGAMPGLGSVLAITLALPLTFVMGPEPSIALLLGLYAGSVYGGSLSAILINTPGTPQAAATVFDGYPMMQQGKGDFALGWATVASTIGGVISVIVLIVAAPALARLGLKFGPIEYFAVGVFALTCVVSVSENNLVKGVLACVLGLLAATIGQDPLTGDVRMHFSNFNLMAGIALVPFLVGLFALSEVIWRVAENVSAADRPTSTAGFRFPSMSDIAARWRVFGKSALIGTGIGTLPGVGATASSMVSYAEARRSSPNRENFGKGEPDGIIASETANNAVTGGALVPTLSLGIPGDPITAVMLGALIIQGITPGPRLFIENADLMVFIFLSLFVVNLALLPLGALMGPIFSRAIRAPEPVLLAVIVVLLAIGTFSVNYNGFDLLVMLAAGLLGFAMRLLRFPLAPVVIGFVLGPVIEQSLRQGLVIARGDFLYFLQQPIALGLFVASGLFMAWAAWRHWNDRRTNKPDQKDGAK